MSMELQTKSLKDKFFLFSAEKPFNRTIQFSLFSISHSRVVLIRDEVGKTYSEEAE